MTARSKDTAPLPKNPFITLDDESDYLSETVIEEQEIERKKRENLNKPDAQPLQYSLQ